MASAAEQLAANLNFGAIAKSEELKNRIWFTLGALDCLPPRHLHSHSRH
jgi:preprotein translocase subunit SecY